MLSRLLKNIVEDTTGATAVEYGLIISLIVIAMIAALQGVATATVNMWGDVEDASNNASNN